MSALEQVLLGQILDAGLPAPKTERRFSPPRMWRFDLSWDLYRIAVEVEGGTMSRPRKIGSRWYQLVSGHVSGVGYENNCEKYNEAALQGWMVLRVTGKMVEDGRALALVERALNAGRKQLYR